MRDSFDAPNEQPLASRPSVIAPAVLFCLFATVLPAPASRASTAASRHDCLTLAEGSRTPVPPRALLEECTALLPDDVELWADLGAAYEGSDIREAEAAYRRALAIDANFADVRLRLAALLLRRGAPAEALAEVEAALRVQPNRQLLLDLRDAALDAQSGAR